MVAETAPINQAVVNAIDEHYLYTSRPQWKEARKALLGIDPAPVESTYAVITRELAKLRDSELHLLSPSELASLNDESKGTRVGTGLIDFGIDVVPATGEARVVTALVGSPAATAGIRPGDVIAAVNGKSTRSLDHEQVLDALRSRTAADLSIRRKKSIIRVRLSPSDAPLHAVVAELKATKAGKIGYIRIAQFTPAVSGELRSTVEQFEKEHPAGYIVDLRNNPGGFLDAAENTAGLFISGSLGAKLRRNGDAEPISSPATLLTKAPLIVLVNEGTASAAEFVAGALQARQRAKLVGVSTYGRGQTQLYVALSGGYGLVVPSALLRTPAGSTFKGAGLHPDILVRSGPLSEPELARERDMQFQRAVSILAVKAG